MSARPQKPPDHSASLGFLSHGRDDHAGFDRGAGDPSDRRSDGDGRGVVGDRELAQRVLHDLAVERADAASASLVGALLLMVASAAVALLSVKGDPWIAAAAGLLFATAGGVVFVVRLRLQRELVIVGRAHGLDQGEATRLARRLAIKALRLE